MGPTELIENERLSDFDIDDFYTGNFIRVRTTEPNYTVDVEYTYCVADILKEAHGVEIGSDSQFLVVLEILDDLMCGDAPQLTIIDKLNAIRETLRFVLVDYNDNDYVSPSGTLVMRVVDRTIDSKIADIRIDML